MMSRGRGSLLLRGLSKLTHVNKHNQPSMVDVSEKAVTKRTALAECIVSLPKHVYDVLIENDKQSKKGPVFDTAIIAGTQGVKKTSDLIPFCHPLPITGIDFDMKLEKEEIKIQCLVTTTYKTGVEMEALTGCNIAALCIIDMCKALSPDIVIKETRLLKKTK
jgi:cyclic pyranopterin phosphate synthase